MYILGLNAYHADSSAAIFKDGILLAATEEERFTRVKHWAGFPTESIKFCLREAGIGLDQVAYITIGRDPRAKILHKFNYLRKNPSLIFTAFDRLKNRGSISSLEKEFCNVDQRLDTKIIKAKIRNIEHHRSHLASAFYASPFKEAALLSIDGSGDFTSTMIGIGTGLSIDVFDSVDFPVSIGLFYTSFTQFLGFPYYGDEYKVMGLAPYGEPKHVDKVLSVIEFLSNGLFTWKQDYFVHPTKAGFQYVNNIPEVGRLFSEKFIEDFGKPREQGEELTQYHKDLASSVQKATEQIIFHLLNKLHKRTGLKQVCIAGGVAQNSVANGKITENTGFKEVYIPSAGHDAGISMGSALYYHHQVLGNPRNPAIYSAYTGVKYSNDEIEAMLVNRGISYRRLEDVELFDLVTDKLIEPGVVGWFNGRAEFGPRALGGRSIIADPRNPKAKDLLNLKIKRRESFRPFAPSILKEYVSEYFTKYDEVPFMEKVFPIRKDKHEVIPAVTHVDGTGRLQTVDKTVSPRYYGLIERFRQKTGVPILLNTSFNENEPIVNSPEEALNCFLRTQMDMLVLENFVIERES